jgi:hypothetical protein
VIAALAPIAGGADAAPAPGPVTTTREIEATGPVEKSFDSGRIR